MTALARELANPVVIAATISVVVVVDPDDSFFIGRQLLSWRRTNKPNPETAEQLGRVGKLLFAAARTGAAEVTLDMADALGVGLSLQGIARSYRRIDIGERMARVGKQMYAAARARAAEVTP